MSADRRPKPFLFTVHHLALLTTRPEEFSVTQDQLPQRVAEAKERLDSHVREIVQWHFQPETGCPFWLEKARTLDFNPLKDVRGYEDLKLFGHFQDEWLRGGPVRRWIPRGLADKPFYVFETGGSTGIPKSRINIQDFETDYEIFGDSLDDATFPKGSDWLMLGPSGPRRLRLAIEHLAQYRGGCAFMVDLDPRWVTKLVKAQRWDELDAYKEHVSDQALKILRAHDVKCMFTTPKLLEHLASKIDLVKAGISGIFCGGTEMNAEFNRFARQELVPGADFVPVYGNTLMGLARGPAFDPELGDYTITYYAPHPRALFEIVDPDDLDKAVAVGETGRVLLTTLTREFFMPRFPERDEGERAAPTWDFPWDGVSNLRLFSRFKKSVAVGVY